MTGAFSETYTDAAGTDTVALCLGGKRAWIVKSGNDLEHPLNDTSDFIILHAGELI